MSKVFKDDNGVIIEENVKTFVDENGVVKVYTFHDEKFEEITTNRKNTKTKKAKLEEAIKKENKNKIVKAQKANKVVRKRTEHPNSMLTNELYLEKNKKKHAKKKAQLKKAGAITGEAVGGVAKAAADAFNELANSLSRGH